MAAPIVVAPILTLVGFTANGIAAGSIAATIQSLIGNVAAKSLFATLQSAATGGYGLAAVNTVAQVVGAVAGVITAALGVSGNSEEDEED